MEYKNQKTNSNDRYFLSDFSIFNDVLNLFIDQYSNIISREYAEKTLIINCDIYKDPNNKDLIDDFIDLYNSFEFEVKNGEGKKKYLN